MAVAAPIIGAITAQTIQGAILRFALSLAVSYITQKLFGPDMPGNEGNPSQADPGVKQRIPSDPANKIPVVYGQDKIHGSIIFADISSDNKTTTTSDFIVGFPTADSTTAIIRID